MERNLKCETYGEIKESLSFRTPFTAFIHCYAARADGRSHMRSQISPLCLSLPVSLLSLPFLCCYSRRLYVTHPLTLELKCFPPPPLLICSLHYSFITNLCSLCSVSMSVYKTARLMCVFARCDSLSTCSECQMQTWCFPLEV